MAYTDIDDPSAYFQTTLYTGNGSTNAITNSGNSDLSPNWVWIKNRSGADHHALYDSVRGANKYLSSGRDILEATQSDGLMSFNSDGFTVGADGGVNTNSNNFVAWQWKAGTSVSGTTTGSGTGKAYSGSVNTDAGFSIITYVANGTAGHTIPHHLGAAPKWVICKSRSENRGFPIQHTGLTSAAYAIFLSQNNAQAEQFSSGSTNTWNNTAASSTVVTLGNNANNNKDNDSYIMYSFAEKKGYSKFGKYTGNGNADGTFVYTGFKPAWLLVKQTTGASQNWYLWDNKRDTFNVTDTPLKPDENTAESGIGAYNIDLLSQGFKFKGTEIQINASGETYIFMAFSEQSFVSSSGVPATAR